MSNRILICGLPNSGKTTFANALIKHYSTNHQSYVWFNGDEVRKNYNDWDFSLEGRLRQTRRMRYLADRSGDIDVIIDYVCPLEQYREIIQPTHIIYIDTKSTTPYSDTKALFEPVKNPTMIVPDKDSITKYASDLYSQLKM